MSIDWELKKVKFDKRITAGIPVLTAGAGYTLGHFLGKAAETYNEEITTIETNLQAVMKEYRQTEEKIEAEIDGIPGLKLWKSGYEKLFGEAQEMVGTSEEGFKKINPEDLSLQGIILPDNYGTYPLLGAAIGLTYGLMKVRSRLSRLAREKKILERIK